MSNGRGMDIAVKDGRMVGVRGRATDRVDHGRLGPKGLFGWQANNAPDRLTRPLVREGGELVPADHDDRQLPEADPPAPDQGLLAGLRRKASEPTGRQPPAGVLLLHDLRRLYLMAQECEVDWEMAGQGAKVARDQHLLATVTDCMEQTSVQVRWLRTRIKEASPQTLTVG